MSQLDHKREPATTLRDAYRACKPDQPLEHADDPWYVDLTPARPKHRAADELRKRITFTGTDGYEHILFTGHRGCGKSTELHTLKEQLRRERVLPVFINVLELLDPNDIQAVDLLIRIVGCVAGELAKHEIDVDSETLKDVLAWMHDSEIVKETETKRGASVGVVAKLFETVGLEIKAGGERRSIVRQTISKRLSSFRLQLLDFIGAARKAVAKHQDFDDFAVIVDSLEHIVFDEGAHGASTHQRLFVDQGDLLRAIPCHVIYTVPVSLQTLENLHNDWGKLVNLPMIDAKTDEGRAALCEVCKRRIDIAAIFEKTPDFERLVAMSGGSIRDLLRMLGDAVIGASGARVTTEDTDAALDEIRKDFDRLLHQSHLDALAQVERGEHIDDDAMLSKLLNLRLVHEYENGKLRWRIHPALRDNPRLRQHVDRDSGSDHPSESP